MLNSETQRLLEEACNRIRTDHQLSRVYLAQRLGKRRHFLGGAGAESFIPSSHLDLNENIVLFWQGTLPSTEFATIQEDLQGLAGTLNQELSSVQN
jgi:hypothetical protein